MAALYKVILCKHVPIDLVGHDGMTRDELGCDMIWLLVYYIQKNPSNSSLLVWQQAMYQATLLVSLLIFLAHKFVKYITDMPNWSSWNYDNNVYLYNQAV